MRGFVNSLHPPPACKRGFSFLCGKMLDFRYRVSQMGIMTKYLMLIMILCCFAPLCMAEQQASYALRYLASYPHTVAEGAKAPLSWDGSDWLSASALVLATASLYLVDEEIRDYVQEQRNDSSDIVMTAAKQFGEGIYVLPALGFTVLGGYLTDSKTTMDTGLLGLKSFVLSQCVTQTLKLGTQRRRPSSGKGKEFWAEGGFERKHDSFPSGHSTIVWSLAPILAHQYAEQRWVAPVVYSIATLTSISRVHDNNHWSSDVFAGAVIGYLGAKLTLADSPRLQLLPNPELSGLSFQLLY